MAKMQGSLTRKKLKAALPSGLSNADNTGVQVGVPEVSCRWEGLREVQKSTGDGPGALLLPIECVECASGPG
jgi:hypothetical protein